MGGGGGDFGQNNHGQGTGLFTWNIVRDNQAGVSSTDSRGGGVNVGGGPLELSHNVYANNEAQRQGGGIYLVEAPLAFYATN